MHQPIRDGVSQGVLPDAGIPLIGWQLADHLRRGVVHDLQQVIAVRWLQRFQSPVIDDQSLHLGHPLELLGVTAVGLGLGQFQEQS